MIPVVIEEETGDLLATVRGVLTEMVGPDEIADDLVKSLLAYKRLLVDCSNSFLTN
jgi:hypothetical protein